MISIPRSAALLALPLAASLPACKTKNAPPPPPATAETRSDVPMLPTAPGDRWIYQVQVEFPAGITAPDAPAETRNHEQTRTYLGKTHPAEGLPEVDTFEVTAPNSPTEREFVEILPDRILMRGSLIMKPNAHPMWLQTALPFVMAGMKAGTALPELEAGAGALKRKIQVVAREDLTVPAGTFPCIRILMTGTDGDIELRRTTWFSPGTGIIAEEKTRYRNNRVLFRESQKLKETTLRKN